MNEADIKEAVKSSLKKITGHAENIEDEMLLLNDLGLESIDLVELIFEVEQRLNCELDMSQLTMRMRNNKFAMTVRDFLGFVGSQLDEK